MPVLDDAFLAGVLTEIGLLTETANGLVAVERKQSRNQATFFVLPTGREIVVKQAYDPGAGSEASLVHEGRFYRRCFDDDRLVALRRWLPQLVCADESRCLVILERLSGVETLHLFLVRNPPLELLERVYSALGEALGVFHRTFMRHGPYPELDTPASFELPWAFTLHRPGPNSLRFLSPANFRATRDLQQLPGMFDRLEETGALWRPSTVVHGDVKGANILVRENQEVALVDWEMAQLGDPAWDIAGVLQDAFVHALFALPASRLASARRERGVPLNWANFQRLLRLFWNRYSDESDSAEASNELLMRSVRFAAIRLLQTAYEAAVYDVDSAQHPAALRQAAANILDSPEDAATGLFGLSHRTWFPVQ